MLVVEVGVDAGENAKIEGRKARESVRRCIILERSGVWFR